MDRGLNEQGPWVMASKSDRPEGAPLHALVFTTYEPFGQGTYAASACGKRPWLDFEGDEGATSSLDLVNCPACLNAPEA